MLRRFSAFTLVDLLAGLATCILLVSIALPTLARARELPGFGSVEDAPLVGATDSLIYP